MLRLSIREITSVSATFLLSSRLVPSSDPPLDPSLEISITDALANGLSITVNGSAWPRTFIRIDEQIDEAVIIIYALMPGRQYDIELGLAACEHEQSIQIITQENDIPDSPILENSSSSSSSSLSSPSTSTPPTTISPPPSTPPPPHPHPHPQPPLTLTDRLTQLHHSLSHLSTERDSLLTSLKSLRRESQKAESSLRSEIDTLKRTFDKNASFELRSRQKLLALQESVKRAQNAARESEEMTREVENEILELTNRKQEKENEHHRMEDEAGKTRKNRDQVEEKERKKVDGMRGELNGLTNKLERLNGKRERMETTAIPDLEAKVHDIEGEIEDAEREVAKLEKEEQIRIQFEDTYLSYQPPLWSPPTRPTHNPRSQSMHTTPATYPPLRRSSLKSTSICLGTSSQPTPSPHPPSLFLVDTSPIIPSSRSSPGTSPGSIINLKGSIKSPNDVPDPLAVGAGRPSRRPFETAIRAGKTAE